MGCRILAEQAWLISPTRRSKLRNVKEKQKALSEKRKAMKGCTTPLTRAGLEQDVYITKNINEYEEVQF